MAEFILGNSVSRVARRYPMLQAVLWRLDFALVSGLISLFRVLPMDTASRLGSRVGGVIGPLLRRKTEMFRENLSTAFPEKSAAEIKAMIRKSWRNAGRILAEYPHINNIFESRDRERLHIEILDPALDLDSANGPWVFVTLHHCNWELASSALSRLCIPNTTLYSPPSNPLLDRMLLQSRKKLNCHLVTRDNATRAMVRSLKQGSSAGLIVDRRVDDGKAVSFFGRDKPSTLLPAKLALKFGIDLIPVRVERLRDAEFKVSFYPPVHPANPEADENDRATDMIQQVHNHFEEWIRADPEDWLCSKRIWPKLDTGNTAGNPEVKHYAA